MRNLIRAALAILVMLIQSMLGASSATLQRAWTGGNDLYENCAGRNGNTGRQYCFAYVIGIVDAMELVKAAESGWSACIPVEVQAGQLRDIVTKWLAEHPEQRQYSAASLVATALEYAFPCKQ